MIFNGPTGSTEPLANLITDETYNVFIAIDVAGQAGEFTGATLDLTFDGTTDVASFAGGKWSVSQGNIIVPDSVEGNFYFNFNNVAPPTPDDQADFDLSITVTAGSDGESTGNINFLDPITFEGVTIYDPLGNIVPSVSIVSSSGAFYAVTDGTPVISVPEPSTWTIMLLGFAGLGFAGYRASRRTGMAAA